MTGIRQVIVAIPAKDEEELLPGCLATVVAASSTLTAIRPDVAVQVVVALDGCHDASGQIATTAGVRTVTLHGEGVCRARDAAVRRGLALLPYPDEHDTWVACTDADTLVRVTWLTHQLIWAEREIDLVVGTVEPFAVADPVALNA